MVLALACVRLVYEVTASMRAFLYYLFLFLLAGIGPGVSLRSALPIRGLFSALICFECLGLLFFNFTVLSFGHLGFPVTGGALKLYSLGVVVASIITLFAAYPTEGISRKVSAIWRDLIGEITRSLAGFNWINSLSALILIAYFLILAQVNRTHFFPAWDHFTYWLVDAKEIFLSGHLRTDGRISNMFSNSSYYPLHAVYLADWWGYPVEQVASCFTLLYAALASGLVLSAATVIAPSLIPGVVCGLLAVNFSLSGYLLTFYADPANSFFVTLFFICLINPIPQERLAQRFCVLSASLIGLSLVKSTNIYYMALAVIIWLLYDFSRRVNPIKSISFRGMTGFISAFLVLVLLSRFYYLHNLAGLSDSGPLIQVDRINWSLAPRIEYISQTIDFLIEEYTMTFIMLVIVCTKVCVTRGLSREAVLIAIAIMAFPAINCADYFISMYGHQSKSLLRYVSTVFFLIPLLIALSGAQRSEGLISRLTQGVGVIALAALTFFQTINKYPAMWGEAHNGQYRFFQYHAGAYAIAEKIVAVVGRRTILIAGDDGDIYSGNMQIDDLVMRYYLVGNSVNGLYRIDKRRLGSVIREQGPSFVLVTRFNDSLRSMFKYKGRDAVALFRINSRKPIIATQVSF
jgi:hypothetical protein